MKIADIVAYPITVPVPPERQVALGIGTMVKRDTVVVKVTTDDGLIGWGESHHGRAHLAIATLVNTTLKQLVLGMEPPAQDTSDITARSEGGQTRSLLDPERDRIDIVTYHGLLDRRCCRLWRWICLMERTAASTSAPHSQWKPR
jgi:hypothetical protein